jgi:hypothetical protein
MSVTCVCGKAGIYLTNPRPRKCIECCCCDCQLALEWCHRQGGPQPPNPPLALLYFDNDIRAVNGERYLHVVKLRETGASERVVAACCSTTLAVSHWAYLGNRLMVLPGARIRYEGETVRPEIRIQTKWWDSEKHGPLPGFSGRQITSSMPWWAVTCGLLPHFARGLAAGKRQGVSVQALIRRLGKHTVAGIPEPKLPRHTVVGSGALTLTLSTRSLAIMCAGAGTAVAFWSAMPYM